VELVAAPRHKRPASRARSAPSRDSLFKRHERDLWIVALAVVGVALALAEAGALGPAGRALNGALARAVGVGRVALPVMLLAVAGALLVGRVDLERARLTWGLSLGMAGVCGLGDLIGGRPGVHASAHDLARAGGWVGVAVGGGLRGALGTAGAVVVLVALVVVALIFATGIGLRALVALVGRPLRALGATLARRWRERPTREEVAVAAPAPTPNVEPPASDPVVAAVEEVPFAEDEPYDEDDESVPTDDEVQEAPRVERAAPPPAAVTHDWQLPPLDLLQRTREHRHDRRAVEQAGEQLVAALAAHGVATTLVGATVGPTVTRYELELGAGVKVARVTSLNKDIAYALAAPDVRILAPIPGRSAIGVEVPNRQRALVALGDLLATDEARAAIHPLDVPIGRDIAGRTVIVNLGEMPHVLISGATGAGKSSGLNSMITSLVMRATPDQIRLILIDPKRVEMGQYNDLPHLIGPVVVDPRRAAGTLAWAVKEMETRYNLFAEVGARDIASYQQMAARGELPTARSDHELVAEAVGSNVEEPTPAPTLPYIVVVVDELNDLMMVAAREVEDSVVRIAQMARAVGIHLVLATQRPSVDVITGVIKANIPSRMAFAVSSLADSRVILDQAGAERLIGKGDMLMVTSSSNVARRLQSPWVSEAEVQRVVDFWRAQGGRTENVVALDEGSSAASAAYGDDDDAVLARARELVLRTQTGSTSMLQRKLRVGFARAGRLMDQLEEEGIVAAGDGSKSRKVLMTLEQYEQQR
jgi:S-DNA-T family DNA segregation ATPase FtsK/SpoIIIE